MSNLDASVEVMESARARGRASHRSSRCSSPGPSRSDRIKRYGGCFPTGTAG